MVSLRGALAVSDRNGEIKLACRISQEFNTTISIDGGSGRSIGQFKRKRIQLGVLSKNLVDKRRFNKTVRWSCRCNHRRDIRCIDRDRKALQ